MSSDVASTPAAAVYAAGGGVPRAVPIPRRLRRASDSRPSLDRRAGSDCRDRGSPLLRPDHNGLRPLRPRGVGRAEVRFLH